MAKKKPTSRTDAVRQAVDQAFQAQIPRERISELLDELGHTAGRLRGAVDDLRPASSEDVKALRVELEALVARVDALEAAPKPKPTPKPAPRRVAAKTVAGPSSAKTATSASKPASGAPEPAASAAKPPAKPRKRAAAQPKPAAEAS